MTEANRSLRLAGRRILVTGCGFRHRPHGSQTIPEPGLRGRTMTDVQSDDLIAAVGSLGGATLTADLFGLRRAAGPPPQRLAHPAPLLTHRRSRPIQWPACKPVPCASLAWGVCRSPARCGHALARVRTAGSAANSPKGFAVRLGQPVARSARCQEAQKRGGRSSRRQSVPTGQWCFQSAAEPAGHGAIPTSRRQ
jgi:hypothetical protein